MNLICGFLGLCVAIALWHLLYDWHWQGDFIAKWKGKIKLVMFVHATTWALGIVALLMAYSHLWYHGLIWPLIFVFFYLQISHYAIDMWKCGYETKLENAWTLPVDQSLHVVTKILAVAMVFMI